MHGHTYHAEVALRGSALTRGGMVADLAWLRAHLAEVRALLDHRLLDEVPGLGAPTLEHLCLFIAARLRTAGCAPAWVKVWREAGGDACLLHAG
ncbi:MAG: 6-carboxytetrahydropterin synthase [Candidatus Protistobacter heckmanni]|nr:6-carboxytetrahydropterin synthase [Candidatus Protistobacter heckmanni]